MSPKLYTIRTWNALLHVFDALLTFASSGWMEGRLALGRQLSGLLGASAVAAVAAAAAAATAVADVEAAVTVADAEATAEATAAAVVAAATAVTTTATHSR